MQIIWAPEAEETFDSIVTFITNNWGTSASRGFIKKTGKLLKSISSMPHMFPETEIPSVRKAVIVSQSIVFYEIHEDHIGLLFFWDNRQEPLSF
ncbi:type II toxin-antitoxin system RelE/ParE family toxin [Pedobacter foliorum]|uniref:type II toxin-antitoxin system RelE/ParE family toxin n=1 Tax=Pedobacter foliorum TaxID=2739058 RepID=UPI0015636CC9|nr:type II toxin-antitoxin system RelE/ParE family toxin [Pedobacter foliorum]NRF41191.1 type II toxin-antitoxin system RelE/ParE family toxin [Pedobacter foliorum]